MAPNGQTVTYRLDPAGAQRVEGALSLIAPKWTTWLAQTLAQNNGPMRVGEIATRIPLVSDQYVGQRLAHMQIDGLVTRVEDRPGAPYQLSEFGSSLSSVHRALFDWSRAHLRLGQVAGAERIEDALRRLHLRRSTAVLQVLDAGGPMRFVHIANEVGLDGSFARQRLLRLQHDGLVTRTGPHHGAPYLLTQAGRALSPVYAAIDHWSNPVVPRPADAPPAVSATRTNPGFSLGSNGVHTAAALRRTTAVPVATFSHGPQPWTPATTGFRSSSIRAR